MEEDELIKRAKEGDLDCFNQLVERYQREVYNLSLRMLGNASAAEDASQDTFLSAFRGIGKFRGGSFRAWLYRIAANACRDQLRSLRRRPATSIDSLPLELEADQPSPEDFAMRRELGEEIKRALAALPPDQRLAVILRDIEGLDYREIAQVTGSSLGTVKSRINRGRARLRHHLEQRRELFP
ncbi:MAG: sigma-70 family RNA polymerase sigma factor [Dehalococcoidia bacterium]|nr:MAG: sigma-70 family RNA polymerase sigma factor [Dehalococcoidia bacterium]